MPLAAKFSFSETRWQPFLCLALRLSKYDEPVPERASMTVGDVATCLAPCYTSLVKEPGQRGAEQHGADGNMSDLAEEHRRAEMLEMTQFPLDL